MNSADQLIFKAANLLEEQEDVEGALEALHEAVLLSQLAGHTLQLIRAKTFLGELLAGIDQPHESVKEFRDVVRLAESFTEDATLVDEELAAARKWLAGLPPEH